MSHLLSFTNIGIWQTSGGSWGYKGPVCPFGGSSDTLSLRIFFMRVFAYSGGDLLDVRVHINVNLSERTSLGREKEFNCPTPYFIRKDP